MPSISLLVDFWRHSRESESLKCLEELESQDIYKKVQIIRLKASTGPFRHLFPARINEIFGVMHMKFLVFDDSVILTGYLSFYSLFSVVCSANMGGSYFTSRIDRYLLINSPELADFFESAAKVAGSLADFQNLNACQSNEQLKRLSFREAQKILPIPKSSSIVLQGEDTFFLPFVQNLVCKADWLSLYLNCSSSLKPEKIVILSPYFNPWPIFAKQSIFMGKSPVNLLTCSESSNAFFKTSGFSKLVPRLYSSLLDVFIKKMERNSSSNFKVFQFAKPNSTFHGKGIEFIFKHSVTRLFGSSNFGTLSLSGRCSLTLEGWRSVHRDIENGVWIFTRSEKIAKMFNRVRSFFHSSCTPFRSS